MQLEKILGSKTKIKVLRKLATRPNWQFSIAELASDVGLDKALVSRAIADLEKLNVVKALRKGPVKLVSINGKNEFVKNIIPAFTEPAITVDKICKEFVKKLVPKKQDIYSVLLYGSTAKGTFTPASDLDIMVVTKKEVAGLWEKLNKISHTFDERDIIIFYDLLTEDELQKLLKQRQPAIVDIVKNHKVIWGEAIK